VDSEKVEVNTYTRTTENDWLLHIVSQLTEKVKIGDCEIEMKAIYNRVGF
jgi:hypothetical protein